MISFPLRTVSQQVPQEAKEPRGRAAVPREATRKGGRQPTTNTARADEQKQRGKAELIFGAPEVGARGRESLAQQRASQDRHRSRADSLPASPRRIGFTIMQAALELLVVALGQPGQAAFAPPHASQCNGRPPALSHATARPRTKSKQRRGRATPTLPLIGRYTIVFVQPWLSHETDPPPFQSSSHPLGVKAGEADPSVLAGEAILLPI